MILLLLRPLAHCLRNVCKKKIGAQVFGGRGKCGGEGRRATGVTETHGCTGGEGIGRSTVLSHSPLSSTPRQHTGTVAGVDPRLASPLPAQPL